MSYSDLTRNIIETIKSIPRGKVYSYGAIAGMAGNPRAARQVVRVLHTLSETERLPWWRVVDRNGRIALKPGFGFEEQTDLLKAEGVKVDDSGRVDLKSRGWSEVQADD